MSPAWSTSSPPCRERRDNPPHKGEGLRNRSKETAMIRVKKIAHASYEMPDVEQQADYYVNVLGLTLAAKEKDAVFLANTVDHHSVVLRKGSAAQCTRVGFQIAPDADLNDFEKQTQAHGVKTARKKDPEPSISDMLVFEDPKGTQIE